MPYTQAAHLFECWATRALHKMLSNFSMVKIVCSPTRSLTYWPDSDGTDLSWVWLTPCLTSSFSLISSAFLEIKSVTLFTVQQIQCWDTISHLFSYTSLNNPIIWRVLDFESRREVVVYPPWLCTLIIPRIMMKDAIFIRKKLIWFTRTVSQVTVVWILQTLT